MEVKDVVISVVVPLVAALMSYFGSRRGTKVSREEFENRKEATPPELLRLEKWSTILKDLEDYSPEFKNSLDLETIYSTYRIVLNRTTLEDRINSIAVEDWEVRRALLDIAPGSGEGIYPKMEWEDQRIYRFIKKVLRIMRVLIFMSLIIFIISFILDYSNVVNGGPLGILTIILVILIMFLGVNIILLSTPEKTFERKVGNNNINAKNIIYRNCYHALRDVFLLEGFILSEDSGERNERKKFEETKEYIKWKTKMDEKGFELSSWNYGLSIDWDNDPEKIKFNELGDDNPVGSESESPKLIQKLFQVKLFSRGPHETNP